MWLRRLAVAVGLVLLLWATAWLAVPPLVKWQAQTRLTALLGRSVTLGEVGFRPWALEMTLRDFAIAAATGPTPAAGAAPAASQIHVAAVRANLALWPLFRGRPVIESLDIEAPRLRLARLSPGHYDVDDLLARLAVPDAAPAAEPTRFALHNLRLRDGQLRFDDRPAGRVHAVDALQLGLPFLSNVPAEVAVTVEPHLSFSLNGSPVVSGARATPFAPGKHALLQLALNELDLAPYLGYLPRSVPVRPTRGALSADLRLEFEQPGGGPPRIALRGWVGARDVALSSAAGEPLLAWRQLRLGLRDVQPLARRLAFDTLRWEGAELHLARDAAGRLNVLRLFEPGDAAAAAPPQPAPAAVPASGAASAADPGRAAPAWQMSLEALELSGARLLWNDAAVRPAAGLQLEDLSIAAQKLQWPSPQPVPWSLSATLRAQADGAAAAGRLVAKGVASDGDAQLDLGLSDLELGALAPYLAQALVPQVDGRLSAHGKLDWAADPASPRLRVEIAQATLDALRVQPAAGRAAADGATLAQLALADVRVDVPGRTAAVGSVRVVQPSLALARDAQGRLNLAQWLRAAPAPAGAAAAGAAPAPAVATAPPWQVQLRSLALDGGRLQLLDAGVAGADGAPWRAEIDRLQLGLQDFSWWGERVTPAARLQLSARIGAPAAGGGKTAFTGELGWNGELGLQPLLADGSLRIARFPVHLFAPYFAERLPVSLLHADLGASGRLSLRAQPGGLAVSAAADLLLGDVHIGTLAAASGAAALASGADDLVNWQSLALQRLKFSMKPGARPQLEVGELALSDFYSRLIVTEQGRFNLQELGGAAAPASRAAPAAAPAPAAAASGGAAAADAGLPLDVTIGSTKLKNGRVDFSDHFVRPNYSAALTELNGELGAFSSTTRDTATLRLHGIAEGTGVLDVSGQINPGARPLALDIKARASDLELAPLSPYAGKYAGYAIDHGKLTLDVAYKIDADGSLQASNRLVLNQLTFGERIESPSATRLPVLLAVALLKDADGVIDINLPVGGSINDPDFSIAGVIIRLVVNLFAKALTAPFSLLFGGGGEELGVVEFEPGTDLITPAGKAAITKVAKALAERPGLHLTVTGMADPASEREAFQRDAIDTRLLAERRREALRAGAPADAPLSLTAEDRARLLVALVRQTDLPDKPRNALGLAKDLPAPEMEALLRRHVPVTDEAMNELAQRRGLAVRDALLTGGLASERLFLGAPRLRGADDGASWTPRSQLSLSAR